MEEQKSDLPLLQARVQAVLVFLLVGALVVIAGALIGVEVMLILKRIGIDQGLSSLLTTVVNAIINLSALGIGFWLARHRPQSGEESPSPLDLSPATPAQPGVKKP